MSRTVCIRRSDVEPFAFGDLQIWDYKAQCEPSTSVSLVHIKPGALHGQARSGRSDKYYYVLSGLVEFQVGEIAYWLTQGDLIIIPQGEWFDYRNGATELATLLVMHTPAFRLDDEEFAEETR